MSTPKKPDVLVFDMDGVLVEVGQSYRESIRATVKHFTGVDVTQDKIQDFKNAGGWNNDWQLSHRLIADLGKTVPYQDVVDQFNKIFFGNNGDGLILKEQWMPKEGLLDRLAERASLAIFTGRVRWEADATLSRYAPHVLFDPLVTEEVVENPKPAPDGLQMIQAQYPGKRIWYLGDTVDDARSAKAAGVPFIGVSTPHNARHEEITRSLRALGAFAVLSDINDLETML